MCTFTEVETELDEELEEDVTDDELLDELIRISSPHAVNNRIDRIIMLKCNFLMFI